MGSVLVEEAIDIDREIYLSVAIDNTPGRAVIIASARANASAGSEPARSDGSGGTAVAAVNLLHDSFFLAKTDKFAGSLA